MLLTPEMVFKCHASQLTEYEQREIFLYDTIFFLGNDCKKIQGCDAIRANNYGYDDERGDLIVVEHDHLAYKYEILGILGKGSFGQVLKCFDHKSKTMRAVKVIPNRTRFQRQAMVEVKILRYLHEKAIQDETNYNIVAIYENFYFRRHLCITFDLHDISLYELLKRNCFRGLSLISIKDIALQIISTLKLLRSMHIIHCDLKPENILLDQPSTSRIKIIDFGSSCFNNEQVYTYIQSRFYRSPEVILGLPYDMMIDIWSLGCILAELYSGYPLFAGENEIEQLACMMEVLGVPPISLLEKATRKKMFFDSNDQPRIVSNSWGRRHWPGTRDLAIAIGCQDTLFVGFLRSCLCWDTTDRMNPDQLLEHGWLKDVSSSV